MIGSAGCLPHGMLFKLIALCDESHILSILLAVFDCKPLALLIAADNRAHSTRYAR